MFFNIRILLVLLVCASPVRSQLFDNDAAICRNADDTSWFEDNDAAAYYALQHAGFTQICAVNIANICSNPCDCAYVAFDFVIELNPNAVDLISSKRTDFFKKYAINLGCPLS